MAAGTPGQAFENVVEANTLLSGLGFENSGLAAAHAVHDGLTKLEETHKMFHGEKVAFGILVHLILEHADSAEIEKVVKFLKECGLPTCLRDLGVIDVTQEKIETVSKAACAEGETIHNMAGGITPTMVAAAIIEADKLGNK